ncbi:FIVAR domain-containing protein [Mediterraneibacter agrestimuris]|uniref:FIVAR domain-containing protein n=1 Tax=Mediterraneibacter agrestimuris TaxID=2941333 RepID=UPI00203C7C40|nr:FIVAR domain-containing protein [Mediterraneibacter agrestimuris]
MKFMKKIITGFAMAVFACIALLPLQVSAAGEPGIQLQAEENAASVSLTLPETVREHVYSLELSLRVESDAPEQLNAEFLFEEGLAKIAEYRYHEDTGILKIYLSGNRALFEGEFLKLGKAVFSAADQEGVTVRVSVVEDSLKVVNGTKAEALQKITYPETIEVKNGGTSDNEPGDGNGETDGSDGSEGNDGSDGNGDTDEDKDSVQALRAELEKTLALAKTYKKEEYTADSFAKLEEAIKAAEEILGKQDAAKEELDAALKNLENAIGALVIQKAPDTETTQDNTTEKVPDTPQKSVKTGDNSVIILWAVSFMMSVGAIGFVVYRRNRYRR